MTWTQTSILHLLALVPIFLVLVILKPTEQRFFAKRQQTPTIDHYCGSFRSCHDCKKAPFQCDWCHSVGCTNHPRIDCPKKFLLDTFHRKEVHDRSCTEIITKNPIFVPANVRRFISLNLKIDDMTIYGENIICEIQVEQKILQVPGSLDKHTVFCEDTMLKISNNVSIGYLRLIWGGAEPHSNIILLIVYNCRNMARRCKDCQALNEEFKCGWCRDTVSCTVIDECPRQIGPWINKNLTCGRCM